MPVLEFSITCTATSPFSLRMFVKLHREHDTRRLQDLAGRPSIGEFEEEIYAKHPMPVLYAVLRTVVVRLTGGPGKRRK